MFVSAAGRNLPHNTGTPSSTPNRSSRQNSHEAISLVQLRDDVTCRVARELNGCRFFCVDLIVWLLFFFIKRYFFMWLLFYVVTFTSPRFRDNYCHL